MSEDTTESVDRSFELRPGYYDFLPDEHLGGKEFQLDEVTKGEIESFLTDLPKGAKVLDAGAGAGVEAAIIESRGAKVFPLDMSRKMLEKARSHGELVGVQGHIGRMVQADIFRLPFVDETFDAVICKDVLSLGGWDDRMAIVRELQRGVKRGGKVLILAEEIPETVVIINGETRRGKEQDLAGSLKEGDRVDGIKQVEFTEGYITRVLSSAGFQNIRAKTEKKETARWISDRLVSAVAEKY